MREQADNIDCSNSVLEAYLKDISKYKIYTQDEIRDLLILAKNGDEKAKDLIVKSTLRFVVNIAKSWQGKGVPLLDLISEGNRGLLYSIDKYDLNKKTPFINYAVHWIKQFMYQTVYWTGREIRLPVSQQIKVIQILKATAEFNRKKGRSPSVEELSEITGIPEKRINYLAQFSNRIVSVDDFIGGDSENNQVCDIIPNGEPIFDEKVDNNHLRNKLDAMLTKLSPREHDIMCMLFGIGMDPMESQSIGDMFGIGAERVRQLKEGALRKLKIKFGKQLKEFLG